MLLQAGVCMRVPFNRVTVKRAVESTEPNDMLDFAGVSLVQECLCKKYYSQACRSTIFHEQHSVYSDTILQTKI